MTPTTPLRILVTAGDTLTPIDAVRGITNVFTGRTGARIAAAALDAGHDVELLTSHPAVVEPSVTKVTAYQTFDDLAELLEERVRQGRFDAVVHAAAVSDYRVAGVFLSAVAAADSFPSAIDGRLSAVDASKKISSRHSELWLRLTPTPKLVDQIRQPWGFAGVLVKFKLEAGVTDEELIERAKAARQESNADVVVANTLESMHERAIIVDGERVETIERSALPTRLLLRIEQLSAIP